MSVNILVFDKSKAPTEPMADLKKVYTAVDEESALDALEAFAAVWDSKYPKILKSWYENWPNLSTYFKFPQELRKLIYTTNTIEGFNRQLKKVTKAKSVFPTDDSLFKMLYLAMKDITKKNGLVADRTGAASTLSWLSITVTGYLNNIFILTIKKSCANMQIRPTAFTIGLIIHPSIALFCVYTEFGIDSVFLKQHSYDVLLALTHRFSFSSCHKKSASCDINSILSQLADFLQTFFQRLEKARLRSIGELSLLV